MPSPINLGVVLRRWRERSGFSLREAGEIIGVSYPTLQRLEVGDSGTDAHTFMAILTWLIKKSDADKSTET